MFQYNTVTNHPICYMHVVKFHRRIFLTLFIWCNYWFVLTRGTSVHIVSLPSYPLHAVPSYLLLTSCLLQWFQCHPHCLGCSWAAVSVSVSCTHIFCKCWEIPTTSGGCPRVCVFIPKGLLNVCIPFGICFCWMQMFNIGSFKQSNQFCIISSAVLPVNEFSDWREFGTYYPETLSICKSRYVTGELQIFSTSEFVSENGC